MRSELMTPINSFKIRNGKALLSLNSSSKNLVGLESVYNLRWVKNRPEGLVDLKNRSDWQILHYLAFLLAPPKDGKTVFICANDIFIPVAQFAIGGEILSLYSHMNRPYGASFSLYHKTTNIQHAMTIHEVFNILSQFLEDLEARDPK